MNLYSAVLFPKLGLAGKDAGCGQGWLSCPAVGIVLLSTKCDAVL
jgi:hypothetical protein